MKTKPYDIIKAAEQYIGGAIPSSASEVQKALHLGKEAGFIAGAEWMQKRIQDESDFWHDVGTPPPFYGHYLVELSNGMVVSDTFDGEEWCYGGTLVKRWLDVYELKKL